MFWLGMIIFAVLAVLPFVGAVILNRRDAATSTHQGRTPSSNPKGR